MERVHPPVTTCEACGWPALNGTRRCPYCRTRLTPERRIVALYRRVGLLPFAIAGWGVMTAGMALLALGVIGAVWAVFVVAVAATPIVAAFLLHRRTSARIRALNRPTTVTRASSHSRAGEQDEHYIEGGF